MGELDQSGKFTANADLSKAFETLLENKNAKNETIDELISKGTLFLLKNKDRYGVWYLTQTTINVLDSVLAALNDSKSENQTLQVLLNGAELQRIQVSAVQIEPVVLNLDGKVNAANNRIEVKSSGNSPVMSQIVAAHYVEGLRDAFGGNRHSAGVNRCRKR